LELSDYLRAMGKRFLILLLVPVIAGGAAFGLLSRQPTKFQARATVRLPVPGEAATSVISQANSDFTEALQSDAVLAKTAEAAHVPRSSVDSGLSVTQSGSSRILQVTYTTDRPETAQNVVATATRAALENLFSPEVARDQQLVAVAHQEYDAARGALDAFGAKGDTLPADLYRQKISEVNQLEVQLVQSQATNGTVDPFGHTVDNTQAVKAFQAAIARTQAEVNRLTALVGSVRPLEDRLQAAVSGLSTAQRDLQVAQTELTALDSPATVATTPAAKIDKAKALIKSLGIVIAVAIVLAVGVIVLLELVRPSSRKRAQPEAAYRDHVESTPPPTPRELALPGRSAADALSRRWATRG
jgi:hypothetical protein